MPWDGSGNYSPSPAPNFPAVSGDYIYAVRFNNVINDIASAFNNALTRDGQGKPSADINWNNKSLTNVYNLGINNLLTTASLSVTGNTSIGGTLAVTGASTLQTVSATSLTNTGSTSLQGVTATTISGTSGTFSGALQAASAAITGTVLTVNGQQVWHSGNFNPGLYAALSGAAFTGNVSTTGNLNVSGTLAVTGNSTLSGATVFGSTINASGTITLRNGANPFMQFVPSTTPGASSYLAVFNASSTRIGYSSLWDGTNFVAAKTDGATSVTLGTNGADRVFIDPNGNVGIGINNPSSAGGDLNLYLSTIGTALSRISGTLVAQQDYITATPNSYILSQLIDNGGSPYFRIVHGAACTNYYHLVDSHYFQNQLGNVDKLVLNSVGDISSPNRVSAVGYKGLPLNSQAAGYTFTLADMGKLVANTTGGWVIPANSTTAFPIGSTIVLYNKSGSTQNVTITTDTLYLAGTTTTGTRTIAARGLATLVKTDTTEWVISGAGVA